MTSTPSFNDTGSVTDRHLATYCINRLNTCQFGRTVVWNTRRLWKLVGVQDRKSTRLNSSHVSISYAVFCLKKKKKIKNTNTLYNHQLTTMPGLTRRT